MVPKQDKTEINIAATKDSRVAAKRDRSVAANRDCSEAALSAGT